MVLFEMNENRSDHILLRKGRKFPNRDCNVSRRTPHGSWNAHHSNQHADFGTSQPLLLPALVNQYQVSTKEMMSSHVRAKTGLS